MQFLDLIKRYLERKKKVNSVLHWENAAAWEVVSQACVPPVCRVGDLGNVPLCKCGPAAAAHVLLTP